MAVSAGSSFCRCSTSDRSRRHDIGFYKVVASKAQRLEHQGTWCGVAFLKFVFTILRSVRQLSADQQGGGVRSQVLSLQNGALLKDPKGEFGYHAWKCSRRGD